MVGRIAIFLAALMVLGGVAHGVTYTKVADVDGTIGTSFGTPYDYVNNFGENDIRAGFGTYQTRRALMRFDINWAAVPSPITAATLQIDTFTVPAGYEDLKLALVTEYFTGGAYPDTTWVVRTTGTNWTTAGGSPDTATEIDVTLSANSSIDVNVLSLINTWKANQSGNFGLIFYDPTQDTVGNSYSRIWSTEYAPTPPDTTTHRKPTLVIIPEPAGLVLLALGGVGVLLRRRRR